MKNPLKKGPKKLAAKPRASSAPESLAKLKETIDAQARELREALQRETATGDILLHDHSRLATFTQRGFVTTAEAEQQ